MYLDMDIVEQIKQGKTPPIEITEGYRWRYDKDYGAMMYFHQEIYRDCEGYGIDVDEWETRDYIIGNTYKVQQPGKKQNIGISILITKIVKRGVTCKVHYEIVGGAE